MKLNAKMQSDEVSAETAINVAEKTLGERIRFRREEQQISLRKMASRLGISKEYLRLLENGERRAGSIVARKLLEELGADSAEIEYVMHAARTSHPYHKKTLVPLGFIDLDLREWLDSEGKRRRSNRTQVLREIIIDAQARLKNALLPDS